MEPTLALTDAELIEVTRKVRFSAQMRALRFMGIDHRQRADGSVLVLRAHFDHVMGGGKPAKKVSDWRSRTEPDWSKIK